MSDASALNAGLELPDPSNPALPTKLGESTTALELNRDFVPQEVRRTAIAVPPAPSNVNNYDQPQHNYGGYNNNVLNSHTNVNVSVGGPNVMIATQRQQVPFVLRALWFVLVGWWLSAIFIVVGYFCCLTVFLAPVGFWFLNRVPQAQTLRMRNTQFHVTERDGVTHLHEGRTQQLPWYYRAIYFPFGLVFGALWLSLAWLISLPILTLPLSVWMIDRSPAVISLQRN